MHFSIPFVLSGLALLHQVTANPIALNAIKARQLGTSDTENDLTNGSGCKAVTVIFARGTTETGNVGSIAGPPFFSALSTAIGAGNLAVQGVAYPADVTGFLAGGDAGGSALMAQLVGQAISQCPQTKIVLSGYSQGGQLVHNAASKLTSSQTAAINSVVIFGDPDDGSPVGNIPASKVDIICHVGDDICLHGDVILAPHLTYGLDAGAAAAFVAAAAGY